MRADLTYNKNIASRGVNYGFPQFLVKNNTGIELLTEKRNEDLTNYLEWLNLADDPNLVVLSSLHHYFYDAEEMKNVKTVVNLIPLNELRDTKSFLHSVYTILTPKSNFIGSFLDIKNHNSFSLRKEDVDDEAVEHGILSKIPFINTLYNLMDSKTNRNLSKRDVMFLLENNGFKVQDITELNKITYFHSQRV
ncbi:MAG TPA: hypothetical protein PLO24_06575 [Bacteroidales bacterium]|jgi:hypothetical protein|nr:hypothetical protein [Bacteroidales bacterium]HOS73310.1 hypothetical protein [Bacteroidales bacterium]HQH25366.1 hypothetical protein [Bacteroidales bacterium]HQJ82966.1 hypothetical protein [Bacteroidales bacterium]